ERQGGSRSRGGRGHVHHDRPADAVVRARRRHLAGRQRREDRNQRGQHLAYATEMSDAARVARLLVESATALAESCGAKAIIAYVDALPDPESLPPKIVLVARDDQDQRRMRKLAKSHPTITVPNVTLDRSAQVKLAAIVALSNRTINLGD